MGGCMAQLPEVRQKLRKSGVDIVFGTHNLHELPWLIDEAVESGGPVYRITEDMREIVEGQPVRRHQGISAFVNIMYGCDNFCSYCIVPYTRGRERSREPADIITELRQIASQGYKEVTLLGQNVNSYGQGLEHNVDFADLLNLASEVEGIDRIRFTTSHPKDVSDKLIQCIAANRKVCEHIHMPLQAGSNEVLRRMNRKYSREHYLELAGKVRSEIPGAAITSDLIVGFPGETSRDFEDTIDMVEKVRFEAAFTFMYSIRSGTRAANLPDQVPLEEKRRRLKHLNDVQYAIADQINHAMEGMAYEVLVEGHSKTNLAKLTGRTRSNHIVIFSGPEYLIGRQINVKITKATTFSLFGELVEE
ncbi:tRNA (N6-isopentenyl adenosine(37)-C2)-methylthiotransferase MiaB [Syntrophomonas palmitatica]|uniref:tRNA (N6-isopentenyl adenosine(37)-C2)-methylthiotransferase MiaB n=1 Tax=Syntrophomonas palmitatica TaxID=402877 RepID=UPI0034E201DB